ncbi:MAG TPA: ClpX C4-type zinc finger protein [Myxococcales bacterium]|nr:ClpX C4-type zinc finger protein [Myxococcales bacterium]
MSEKPPPVLGNARVLEYAVLDESVTYSGHSSLFVGKVNEGLKELGPVPCLAIVEDLKSGEITLLHCDHDWDLLGIGGKYESTAQAKTSAERAYHGVSGCWIDAKITRDEALRFRDEIWAEKRCSFCDKIPPDFNKMIERNNVRICDLCIVEFQKILAEEPQSKE